MKKLLCILLVLLGFGATAQRKFPIDSLNNQIGLYANKMQSPMLFVHFDKNVYTNNEGIWFTAYLVNYADAGLYHTLSLALMRDADRAVVMEDRFTMGKGACFGNTVIPDTVAPGNYTFLVTTSRLVNGKPEMVFAQPVTIKTQSEPVFTASLNPLDTSANAAEQKVMLLVGVPGPDPDPDKQTPPPQIGFRYFVGSSAHPLMKGEAKADRQYIFTIPSHLLVPGNNLLHVQLSYKGETRDISMALPARPGPAMVHFFPEGGNLVNGLPCTVGLEVRTAAGAPLGANEFLLDGEKVIDTLTTNSFGLGRFTLTPKAGHSYSLKLYNGNKKDTSYLLPQPLTAGPTLSVNDAVVNDTLTVTIKDNQQEKLYLTGHNYREVFFTKPLNMTTGVKNLELAISDLPKGLAELTLTDSLGRPFAERLFFAHYDKREPLMVTTDKDEYTTRQKVNVKIKMDANMPNSGLVSVACVQENRISLNKKNDIESYFYLKHDLGELPVRESYFGAGDKKYLEDILLIKGWSRYTWMDMLKAMPDDTIKQNSYLSFGGDVYWIADRPRSFKGDWLGEPIKHSVDIVNLAQPLNITTTTKTGAFTLADSNLLTLPGKWVNLLVIGKDPKDYRTIIKDPYVSFDKALASRAIPEDHETRPPENSSYLEIPENEHAHHLKEVRINGNGDDGLYGMNACGDYVCRFNILNCPNHPHEPDNKPPVKGQYYYTPANLLAGNKTQYLGCVANAGKFKGVYYAQEFYPVDYDKESSSLPDYVSTVYWNYRLKVSSLRDTGLSFYTSDITGRFKIVVQGITGKEGVTYGEKIFNVVKGK